MKTLFIVCELEMLIISQEWVPNYVVSLTKKSEANTYTGSRDFCLSLYLLTLLDTDIICVVNIMIVIQLSILPEIPELTL